MSKSEIFITNAINISAQSFYPRNYDPKYLFVRDGMLNCPVLSEYVIGDIKGGSTPPAYFFYKSNGIPFIKTAAVSRHFINTNDLQRINENFHNTTIKRSITHPYDIIYTTTGKFMGKAAMCPPTISEMNMSQNSVVIHTATPKEAAFLTIYLNSKINRIQVRGSYSITKQKYLNQGKIAQLKVMKYEKKYDLLMERYIKAFDNYYTSIQEIKKFIEAFDTKNNLPFSDEAQFGFSVSPSTLDKCMLCPNYYRPDVDKTISSVIGDRTVTGFNVEAIKKGDEIGSENYLEDGVPFIKTSDIMNFDVDYEPDCYSAESTIYQLEQEIRCGDIIFTKDGKPGEVAIIQEDDKIIISSGLVKYRPENETERYWLFLLLTSKYGKSYFKKWFVLASTMLHLRADFFNDFKIPEISDYIRDSFILPLKKAFETKKNCYDEIIKIKTTVEDSFTNPDTDLNI